MCFGSVDVVNPMTEPQRPAGCRLWISVMPNKEKALFLKGRKSISFTVRNLQWSLS